MNFIKTSLVGTFALAATLMAEQPLLKVGLIANMGDSGRPGKIQVTYARIEIVD